MAQGVDNKYLNRMADDNELCVPVINNDQINLLLARVIAMVEGLGFSDYAKPKVVLDLEQLQILDYAKLPFLSSEQIDYIRKSLGEVKANPDDLIFFGLRSLVAFVWELPKSTTDVQVAAAHEVALHAVINKMTEEIDLNFWKDDTLLPYWMRLSYLRVLSQIPEEVLVEYRLDKVACIPIKNTVFNASSKVYNGNYYITMNYALEPILKFMNRFLVHFFTTQGNSGPKRIQRALDEVAAVVFQFIRNVPSNEIFSYSILYGIDNAASVQWLTADQVDFIFKHEVGHLFYRHPQRLQEIGEGVDKLKVSHVFEYEADAFAASMLKAEVGGVADVSVPFGGSDIDCEESVKKYIDGFSPVLLLFIYMSFVDEAGARMRRRLSSVCSFVPENNGHPIPKDRLDKLKQIIPQEVNIQNPLVEYAEKLFGDILSCIDELDDAQLIGRMKSYI
ncbi:hypothetical protein ABHN98_03765 [Pseudomonas syringae]